MALKFKIGDRVRYKWAKPGEMNYIPIAGSVHAQEEMINIELYGTVIGYTERFEVIIQPDFVPVIYVKEENAEVDTIETIKTVMENT